MTDEEAMELELEFIKALQLSIDEKDRLIKLWNTCDFLRRQNERMRNKEKAK